MVETFYQIIGKIVPPGIHKATITDVYDGDTVWAIIPALSIKIKIRFAEINSSELRGGSIETRQSAKFCKDIVSQLILGETLTIKVHGLCKYFRHISTIYVEDQPKRIPWLTGYEEFREEYGINLNRYMIAIGIAAAY
jgi:endonuclease YncB( thermonuclease family)